MTRCQFVSWRLLLTLLAGGFGLLLLVGTPPARAQIAVSGPQAAARPMQAWCDTHIPTRFRARSPLPVRLLDARAMAAYVDSGDASAQHGSTNSAPNDNAPDGDGQDGVVDGLYESDPDAITLLLPDTGSADMFTFAHEYGHFVWFQLLTKDDRRRYESVYKQQRAARRLVTAYAGTDVEEGFAEAFAFYVNEPPLLAWRDPASYRFLCQCLLPAPTPIPTHE